MNKNQSTIPKVAITGGMGFLGSYMTEFLKQKGCWVRAIGNRVHPENEARYSLADEIVIADLTDRIQTEKALSNIDFVYHFAADMGGVGYFSAENYYPFIRNMTMDLNILSVCETVKIKRLFYPSSACIYPTDLYTRTGVIPNLAETSIIPANPDQMYGWEKLVMTLLSSRAPFDIRTGILHTIFGPGQEYRGKKAKFPPTITYKAIQSKLRGIPIEIWGDGSQIRTFLYITDAIEKIYEVMTSEKYWGPVNISSDEQVTVLQCADWLCEIAEIPKKYKFDTSKPTGVMFRGVDNSKFDTHYHYRNSVSTKEGFRRIYEEILQKTISEEN